MRRKSGDRRTAPVLVVTPGSELYGSDRMLLEAVRGLQASHSDVIVVLPAGGPIVAELLAAGARVWHVPTLVLRKASMKPSRWLRLFTDAVVGTVAAGRMLARIRPCALYVNTMTLPLWPVIARCAGVPVVVHVHEAERDVPVWVRRLLALPLLAGNRVLVNSEFSRSVLGEVMPRLARSAEVVLNGVAGPPEGPALGRPVLVEGIRVLYLGRISPRKGADLAVEAACRALEDGMDMELELVGGVFPGYEWFEDELHRTVLERGLQDRIRFRGFQPSVWRWVADADVVVVPSVMAEPFGNTAVEALLGARPVIAADHSGLREAVDGFCSAQSVATSGPGAPEDWAEAIELVRQNWQHMRSAALVDAERAQRRYDPRRFGEDVAHAVLGTTRRGARHE